MAHLGLKPMLTDMDCRIWNNRIRVMSSKTIHGELAHLTAESADVDLYVCGFMCTPFTPNGLRKAWCDEHAKTILVKLEDHQSSEAACLPAGEGHGHLQQLE